MDSISDANRLSSGELPDTLGMGTFHEGTFFDEHESLNMPNQQMAPHYCLEDSANVHEQSSNFPTSCLEASYPRQTDFVSMPRWEIGIQRQSSVASTAASQFYSYLDNDGLLDTSAYFPSILLNQSSAMGNDPYFLVPVSHPAGEDEKDMHSIQSFMKFLDVQPSQWHVTNKSTCLLRNPQTLRARMDKRVKLPSSVPQSLDMPTASMPMLDVTNEPMTACSTNLSMVASALSSQPPPRVKTACHVSVPMMLPRQSDDETAALVALPKRGRFLEAVMKAGPLLQQLLVIGPLPDWNNPPPMMDIPVVPMPFNAVPCTYMTRMHN